MKMRIAICEDNQEHMEILKDMIVQWSEQEDIKVDVGCFQSAEQFLFLMKDRCKFHRYKKTAYLYILIFV